MTEAIIIYLLRKLMDWFLYDNGLRHERVKGYFQEVQKETSGIKSVKMFKLLLNAFSKTNYFQKPPLALNY